MMNYDYVTLADTKQQFFPPALTSAVDKSVKYAGAEHSRGTLNRIASRNFLIAVADVLSWYFPRLDAELFLPSLSFQLDMCVWQMGWEHFVISHEETSGERKSNK